MICDKRLSRYRGLGSVKAICVRKISSIQDFKTLAVAQIAKNDRNQVFFFLTYTSYEWVRDKLFLNQTMRLDDNFIAAHFPILAKYAKWDGRAVAKMDESAKKDFYSDMAELFGFAAGCAEISS